MSEDPNGGAVGGAAARELTNAELEDVQGRLQRIPAVAASLREAEVTQETNRARWAEMSALKKRLRDCERWAKSEREGWRTKHRVRAWLHDRGVLRAGSLERIEGAMEYARTEARRGREVWQVALGNYRNASERFAGLLEQFRPQVERECAAAKLHREQGWASFAAGEGRDAAPMCRELAAEEGGGARRAGTVELVERER